MKKIVFFIGELSEGGAERVVSLLSNKFVENEYDVTILKYNESINFYALDNRVNVTSVFENTKSKNTLKNLLFVHKYFKNNADIVISFLAKFNMLAIIANSFNNIPIIVSDRNDPNYYPNSELLRTIRNVLYKKADKVIVQTVHNKGYFNYLNNKCIVINNPIDLKEKAGLALKTKKEDLIISVGRLKEQKNQKMLIHAFSKLLVKFPNYKLKIFGEGPYREELQTYIDDLCLRDSVSLVGQVKNIFEEMAKAKVFALTSDYEGMPNVLIEAMCLGLPCISTKVSGSTELIQDGINGYLIDNEDQLLLRIEQLLIDNEINKNISRNATDINEKLNIDSIYNQWLDIITHL